MKVSLFNLALFTSLVAACLVIALATLPQNEFSLNVTVITSEHSRDSNSVTTNLCVSGNTLVYEETYHGAHANRHQPLKKEYKLTNDDRDRLIGLLKDKALLTTKTISKSSEQRGLSRDFELSIASKLAGKVGLISINAPRTAIELKTDPLYQSSVFLIAELYRIINRTDPDVTFSDLID
ncbi:MAG TPA: hypothetical protein VHE60_00765 [Pyrinomonadaceae bacterium]|nr:hypothetical protein [Pyrinomonadaceae bacterium]